MKIAGLQKLSLCDYPGVPSAVIFLQGCNLNCSYCHNRALLPLQTNDPGISFEEVRNYLFLRRGKIEGVVITGGEPTVHKELRSLVQCLADLNVLIKLDTNGTNQLYLKELLDTGLINYVAMDIKAPWDKYELVACTKVNVENIKKSMLLLASSGVKHHFRTTKIDHLIIFWMKMILKKSVVLFLRGQNMCSRSIENQ